ncbi:MAG: hypothetical protein V3W34_19250 [Phycisphaerae bacterium]
MFARTAVCMVSALFALVGCNTDPVWEPEQQVEGPTTRIDRPDGIVLRDIRIAGAREVDLVEEVLTHRAMYHRTLTALHQYYRDHGYEAKRIWAAKELADVKRIKPFRYVLSGEIPSDRLVPRDSIPEADALYQRGLALLDEGGHTTPVFYRKQKMTEALAVFRELVETYPSSDKIDDAAFYCGEIHKEYFKGEEPLAVRWYERSFTWNPQTPHPARFQAAAVYDLRLHQRDRALELYHAVIEHETFNRSNVSFAMRRISELTREMEPSTPVSESAATFAPAGDDGE